MKPISTIDEMVEALGGDTAVAKWLNITQGAVGQWKIRGEIPGGWQLRIIVRLKEKGLAYDPRVFGLSDADAEILLRPDIYAPPRPKRPRSAAHV